MNTSSPRHSPAIHRTTAGGPSAGWRSGQISCRQRLLAAYDEAAVARYDATTGCLSLSDEAAYRTDLSRAFAFAEGMHVLDVGAGSGTLTRIPASVPGLHLTALEPIPAMLRRLRSAEELSAVTIVEGFTDHADDRRHFPANTFDAILSRQLSNGLYDPLAAFRNWMFWLKPGGVVLLVDGFYGRDAWQGSLESDVDALPLSACQTMATVPYLLEAAGFSVASVQLMEAVNLLPATRTKRYLVVATVPESQPEGSDRG